MNTNVPLRLFAFSAYVRNCKDASVVSNSFKGQRNDNCKVSLPINDVVLPNVLLICLQMEKNGCSRCHC